MCKRLFSSCKRFGHDITIGNYYDPKKAISNRINVLDVIRNFSFKNYEFQNLLHYRSKDGRVFVQLYPSSISEYNQYCEKLKFYNINYKLNNIDPEEDIIVDNVLITNGNIDDYDYQLTSNNRLKHYYNLPAEVRDKYFFKNFPLKNFVFFTKSYFYKMNNNYKISPNILRIYHFDGLNEEIIRNSLGNFKINRISPPSTDLGYWSVYFGDKKSYMEVLSKKISHENNDFIIKPNYQSANTYPIGNKSKNIVEIYSRAPELSSYLDVKNALNEDCIVYHCKINKGTLYTIYAKDLDSYERIIYKNGLPLNGTCDYTMNFGDKISINNILNKPILLNFPKEFKTEAMEKLKNFNYKMNKNESNFLIRPRNIEELNILNDGIEINSQKRYIFAKRIPDLKVENELILLKPDSLTDSKDFLTWIFHPFGFSTYNEFYRSFVVHFDPKNYFRAFFENTCVEKFKIHTLNRNLHLISYDRKSYVFPLVLIVKTNFQQFHKLKIPFDHHFIKKDGEIRPVIKVKFEDFLENVHQTIDIDGHRVTFLPHLNRQLVDKTILIMPKFAKDFKKKLAGENIECDMDETGSILYPHFENIDQFRCFLLIFSQIHFHNKASLKFGKDIQDL